MRSLALAIPTLFAASFAIGQPPIPPPASSTETGSSPNKTDSPSVAEDPEIKAIESSVQSYKEAFNKRDAAAVAEHFSTDSELTLENGETIKGRQSIQEEMENYFKQATDVQLELVDVSINIIAPSVAIESGTAVITKGNESESSTYRAVHVKGDQGWKLNRVQEDPTATAPPSNYERLKTLEWMVGSWKLNSDDSNLSLKCRWTTNQNFLVVSYSVLEGDAVDFEGTQIIGWDPSKEIIRSWMFDSDGGFGSGAWMNSGDTWTVKTINVVPDGSQATATNIYRVVDENTVEYRSIGRTVGGTVLANVPAASFVRISE